MLPKASFWGWFTRVGRLKNKWARGLADPDAARGLSRLRQVREKLTESPAAYTYLWAPFLDSFLERDRIQSLEESDFNALIEMGALLVDMPGTEIRPEDVWQRVISAFDARGEERQARALLTRVYNAPSTTDEVKNRCALDLARRGAKGDEHLNIYVKHLQGSTDLTREQEVTKLLTDFFSLDFNVDQVRLKRAGEAAQNFLDRKVHIPGMQTVLGLYALQIMHDPALASTHFASTLKDSPNDRVAVTGLLSSLIRQGEHRKAEKLALSKAHSSDLTIVGLMKLNAAMHWLDVLDIPKCPSVAASDLGGLNLELFVGEVIKAVTGRLYLLEGNARRAAELLGPYADSKPKDPRWNYYAAWASVLCGDSDAAAKRLSALAGWPGRWTIACILLDLAPNEEERAKIQSHFTHVPKEYRSVVDWRMAYTRFEELPELKWTPGSGSLEEDLEALRTVAGRAFYTRDREALTGTIAMPLFERLPLVDQLVWRALDALLSGDETKGRALLEESAVKHSYARAGIILSVHLLEQKKTAEAAQLIEHTAINRSDRRVELLRAYLVASGGKREAAMKRLDRLIAQGVGRAHYALGNLLLHSAVEARKVGREDRVRLFREQAAGAFAKALDAEKLALRVECKVLASCTAFMLDPAQGAKACADLTALQVDSSRIRPWALWMVVVANLWKGDSSRIGWLSNLALELIEQAGSLDRSAAEVLAGAAAGSCLGAADADDAAKLVTLLDHLSKLQGSDAIERLRRMALTAASRLRFAKTDENLQPVQQVARLVGMYPANGSLVLLLAQLHLRRGDKAGAAAALREARPFDEIELRAVASLADLIEGKAPAPEILPLHGKGASQQIVRACSFVHAAAALAAGKFDDGYQALLSILPDSPQALMAVVKMDRFLPHLLALSARRGQAPPPLVEMIKRLSEGVSLDGVRPLPLARCAMVAGETSLACSLWDRVVSEEEHPDGPLMEEYLRILCHLAVLANKCGESLDASHKLRKAARLCRGEK